MNNQIALKNVVCMWDACDTYKQPRNNKARDRESRHTMYEACVHGLLNSIHGNLKKTCLLMVPHGLLKPWCEGGTEKLKAKLVCKGLVP